MVVFTNLTSSGVHDCCVVVVCCACVVSPPFLDVMTDTCSDNTAGSPRGDCSLLTVAPDRPDQSCENMALLLSSSPT